MTWSNSNTITYTAAADNHTAMVYMFDTYLAARGWTVAAHPDASTFKRKLKYTATNYATNASFTQYHWVNWNSSSAPTETYWYEDATFTTVPGDLGTSTTTSSSWWWNDSSISTKNWRFWTSSANANACLVTRGKQVVFYWPGMSKWYIEEAPTWSAGTQNSSTYYFPSLIATTAYWATANAPFSVGNTGSKGSVVPLISASNTRVMEAKTYKNFPMGYGADTSSQLGSDVGVAWYETNDDTVLYVPSVLLYQRVIRCTYTSAGSLWLSGSNYYLNANNSTTTYGLLFNMGTSEPTLT